MHFLLTIEQPMRLQRIRYFLGCFCIVFGLAGCRSNPVERSLSDNDRFSYAMPDDFQQSVQAENSIPPSNSQNEKKDTGFLHRFSLPLVNSGGRSREKAPNDADASLQPQDDSLVQMTPSTINRWKVFGKIERNFRSLFFIGKDKHENSLARREKDESDWDRSTADRPNRLPLAKSDQTPLLVPPPAPAVDEAEEFEVLGNDENVEEETQKKKGSFKDRLIELWPYASKR